MKSIRYAGDQVIELGKSYTVEGSPDRRARLEALSAEVKSMKGHTVWIDAAQDMAGAERLVQGLGGEAKRRREMLKNGSSTENLIPMVVIVNHVGRLDDREKRVVASLCRSAAKLAVAVLVTDSPASLPDELSELVTETLKS